METELFNFNIPTELKDQFRSLCKTRYRKMTDQLIELIYEFVRSKQSQCIQRQIDHQKPIGEVWGDLIKDPASQTWVPRSEYLSNVR